MRSQVWQERREEKVKFIENGLKYAIRCDLIGICFSKTLITHIAETSNGARAPWRPDFLKILKVTLASFKKIETKNLDVDHSEIY
jgi:hypothetical protein